MATKLPKLPKFTTVPHPADPKNPDRCVFSAEGTEYSKYLGRNITVFLRVARDDMDRTKWRLDRSTLGPWEGATPTLYNTPAEAALQAECFNPKPFKFPKKA